MGSALQCLTGEHHVIPQVSSNSSQAPPTLSVRPTRKSPKRRCGLTTLARALLLLSSCILFNVICWVTSGILFGRRKSTTDILSLCLLAWTTGLRHGKFFSSETGLFRPSSQPELYRVNVIFNSAIDNATRTLIDLNQLPVTCGLYFSLGHSTIVIAVNVAIAISSDVYKKINGVGDVGSIVGAAVSGSFLFLIGLANSIILWRLLRRRRRVKEKQRQLDQGIVKSEDEEDERCKEETPGLMMRILGPVTTFVNRPWKMYPVGVLFGFGFDTASSIALIAITALAKKGANGESISRGSIVILPFLFTAGMILVDSFDSVLMLYSYAGFTEQHKWALIRRRSSHVTEATTPQLPEDQIPDSLGIREDQRTTADEIEDSVSVLPASSIAHTSSFGQREQSHPNAPNCVGDILDSNGEGLNSNNTTVPAALKRVEMGRRNRAKLNTMSNLSIFLTLISILVALSISLITIMGLIGNHCSPCQEAANSEGGGGLAGRWWRGWEKANDNSGFIGAAIVGGFIVIVAGWYAIGWSVRRWKGTLSTSPEQE